VEFDATATSDPDSEILEFFWSSNIDGLLSERPPFLARLAVGHHFITLAVDDGNYNITRTIEIDVLDNRAPMVEISYPPSETTFYSDELVELNGSTSHDLEDWITYFWVSDRSGYLGNEPVLNINLPRGVHRITLWIDDAHGHNVSTSISVTVLNLGPTAGISAPEVGATFLSGSKVQFMSLLSSDPEDDRLLYEWFVRPVDGDWVSMSTNKQAERTFEKAGAYEVRLVVSDGKETDETTTTFNIKKAPKKDGDDTPGFGAMAALVGVATAAAMVTARRRRD
jgi:hypothetical protein